MTHRNIACFATIAAAFIIAGSSAFAADKATSSGLFGFKSALDTVSEHSGAYNSEATQSAETTPEPTKKKKKKKKKKRRGSYH